MDDVGRDLGVRLAGDDADESTGQVEHRADGFVGLIVEVESGDGEGRQIGGGDRGAGREAAGREGHLPDLCSERWAARRRRWATSLGGARIDTMRPWDAAPT